MASPTKQPRRICTGCGKKIKTKSGGPPSYHSDAQGRAWHWECFEARFGFGKTDGCCLC